MNSPKFDNVAVGNDNGWHEWGKHVLEELKRLSKSQETMGKDIFKKLDDRQKADEARLTSCNHTFLQSKIFYWLLLVLLVVFTGLTTLSLTNKDAISRLRFERPVIVEQIKPDLNTAVKQR